MSFLQKSVYLPFFIGLFLIATEKPGDSDSLFHSEVLPNVTKQGDVCLLRVSTSLPVTILTVGFNGKTHPFYSETQERRFAALLGIDLDTRPGQYQLQIEAIARDGTAYSNSLLLQVKKTDFETQRLSLPRTMVDLDQDTLARVKREATRLNTLFEGVRNERLWTGGFVIPVEGPITGRFGMRRVINGQRRNPHTGIDLQAGEGTPVHATNGGVIVLSDHLFFSGKSVIIDHGLGIYSMYFHLSEAIVHEGDRVSKASVIGRVGSTGRSTAPHLHWGIKINGARVDPLSLLQLANPLGQ